MDFAELHAVSNFSFLEGASHPEEYIIRAKELGYHALAITDRHTLAGIVRAHTAAKEHDFNYIIGAKIELTESCELLLYPRDQEAYGKLCELLTLSDRKPIALEEFLKHQCHFAVVVLPQAGSSELTTVCCALKDNDQDQLVSIALSNNHLHNSKLIREAALSCELPLIATNNTYYHTPERRMLQDVLTCIKNRCTIQEAGFLLQQNAERHLKSPIEIAHIFRDTPEAIKRTVEIAEIASSCSLDNLSYSYPDHSECLETLTWQGARERYPNGIPTKVCKLIADELQLISELNYDKYFLTCYDIVSFARSRNILCQGRGSAANSVVCYCLGITAVDPDKIDLLFARFVSKERNEPPDIDIDFEHERREEVIQYIYNKYGRNHAALTGVVITYRHRSAIRDTGKAMGLPLDAVDRLAKSFHHWTKHAVTAADIRAINLDPKDLRVRNTVTLATELLTFPRHLSQHVGGFIISEKPLSQIVPIVSAAMEERTMIEWDKDDIEALRILKIDVLGLGMLSCIRKALELINSRRKKEGRKTLEFHSIPSEDPATYKMIQAADTIGVFQIESRAQMSMLPRLKPRCFYDLVIEVAIVRPGPIQGKMVHPYLRRRNGLERITYPDKQVEEILGKTLGVPLFQEQAMRLAIVVAGFTPDEAEKLRRTMAAWKRKGDKIKEFQEQIVAGMRARGYSDDFAESCVKQIQGFSEYGFPESHAASFALLVYASAWIKKHYPAEFAAALINSQPMGFYAPAQIVTDAKEHGVEILPIDVNYSGWNCALDERKTKHPPLRLGMRLVKGLQENDAAIITQTLRRYGRCFSIHSLWLQSHHHSRLRLAALRRLAEADAFKSMQLTRREAFWEIESLPPAPLPLDEFEERSKQDVELPKMDLQQDMFHDYYATGLSLKAHPISFLRKELDQRGIYTARSLRDKKLKNKIYVSAAGMVLFRQRPGTSKGVVFITLEDETGICNLIINPKVFERYRRLIMQGSILVAYGTLERIGAVVYISTNRLTSAPDHHLIQ